MYTTLLLVCFQFGLGATCVSVEYNNPAACNAAMIRITASTPRVEYIACTSKN